MNMEYKENRPGAVEYHDVIEGYDEATPDGQLRTESNTMRHKEAYKRMTKGAVPLVQNSSESLPNTPSRKRCRYEDANGGDSSSIWEPNSPQDHSQSTPRLPLHPICTPRLAVRRRSEPNPALNSSAYPDPWRPIELFESQRHGAEQDEQSSSPAWMIELLEMIRPKYPESSFGSEGDKVKCFDCEGQLFVLGAKRNIGNFEKHLVTKRHQGNVQARQERGAPASVATPCQSTSLNFQATGSMSRSTPQDRTSLKNARAQYLWALENDGTTKEIRLSLVERRITDSEVAIKESLSQLKESFDIQQHCNESQVQSLDECFKVSQEVADSKMRELDIRVHGSERRAVDRFNDIEESVKKFSTATGDFEKNALELKKTAMDLRKANAAFEEVVRDKVANNSGKLDSSITKNKESLEVITERVGKAERRLRVSNDRFEDLFGKVKDDQERLAGKIQDLEHANKKHGEFIHDLESQLQIRTDELQLERQSEQQLRKGLSDRMEAIFRQHADRCSLLETESEARVKSLEELMERQVEAITTDAAAKMTALETVHSQKTKSLEEMIARQSDKIDQFESIIPLLMEDTEEMRQLVEKSIFTRPTFSSSRFQARRVSSHGRPRIRRSFRKSSTAWSR